MFQRLRLLYIWHKPFTIHKEEKDDEEDDVHWGRSPRKIALGQRSGGDPVFSYLAVATL